jgi:hypothetical protein
VNNNKYTFTLPKGDDKYINIPIEIKWDLIGQDDAIEKYQEDVVEEIVGFPGDFEILRFAHDSYDNGSKTDIKYDFHFFGDVNGNVPANPSNLVQQFTTNSTFWYKSYIPEGFLTTEIYYYVKPFTKSFFKLDFYDTKDTISQTNYFTVIIPVQQGFTVSGTVSSLLPDVQIKIPSFKLDYVGDKEGFFLYWLRDKDFYNGLNTFYMTAKFFDARLGIFVKMMNTPQKSPLVGSPFTFNPEDFFYYKVILDYNTKTYQIFDNNSGSSNFGSRVGTTSSIKWYEYVNP